jgi:hypothetical protein
MKRILTNDLSRKRFLSNRKAKKYQQSSLHNVFHSVPPTPTPTLGPAQNDPLRCRKTGRYLHYKSFQSIVNMGGLNALPIVKSQGADLRTGEQKEIEKEKALLHFTLFCEGSRWTKIVTKIEILSRM